MTHKKFLIILATAITCYAWSPVLASDVVSKQDWLVALITIDSQVSSGVSYRDFVRSTSDMQTKARLLELNDATEENTKRIQFGSHIAQIMQDTKRLWSVMFGNDCAMHDRQTDKWIILLDTPARTQCGRDGQALATELYKKYKINYYVGGALFVSDELREMLEILSEDIAKAVAFEKGKQH